MQIVAAFTNTEHTIGMESVQFFLPEFMAYLKTFGYLEIVSQKPHLFYKILKHDYLTLKSFEHWNNDIIWGDPLKSENPNYIKTYRFTVGMKKFRTSNEQTETMQLMRRTAKRFPEQNITTFMYFWLFADQYRVILPNTIQNISIALVVMIIISTALIPHPLCAMWVAIAIASIDVGVIG